MSGHKSYYDVLGVGRNATKDEIQKAYRKLARKHHPDINKASDAEETFKAINEAYAVLSDEEKRGKYDRFGKDWEHAGAPGTGGGSSAWSGENVRYTYSDGDHADFSDFFHDLFGRAAEERQSGRTGRRRGSDQEAVLDISLKEAFHGERKNVELSRVEPGRDGRPQTVRKSYVVTIPKGADEGMVIRLSGQGGEGVSGAPAGDLYLHLHILPDPVFTRNGDDLAQTVDITPWEGALGAKILVTTMDGRINMTVPAGTSSNRVFRIPGKGMPRSTGGHGDLLVTVRIVVPKRLSDEEERLFTELAKASTFNPRP